MRAIVALLFTLVVAIVTFSGCDTAGNLGVQGSIPVSVNGANYTCTFSSIGSQKFSTNTHLCTPVATAQPNLYVTSNNGSIYFCTATITTPATGVITSGSGSYTCTGPATPPPTPSPTPIPTPTPTPSGAPTGTPSPSPTPTPTPSPTPTPVPTQTPITYIQSGSGTSAFANPVCTYPAVPTNGDFLVAFVQSDNASDTWTGPTGWTELDSLNGNQGLSTASFWKQAGASESTTYTFTPSGSHADSVVCAEYRYAANGSAAIDQHGVSAYGTTLTPSLTPTVLSDFPVADFISDNNTGGTFTWTGLTTGWTAIQTLAPSTNTAGAQLLANGPLTTDIVTAIQASATANLHATAQTNYLILLRPPAVATPSPSPSPFITESSICTFTSCGASYTQYYNLTTLGPGGWFKCGYEAGGTCDYYYASGLYGFLDAGPYGFPAVYGSPLPDFVTAANPNANGSTWTCCGAPTATIPYTASLNDGQNSAVKVTAIGQGFGVVFQPQALTEYTVLVNMAQYCAAPQIVWGFAGSGGTSNPQTWVYGPFTDTSHQSDTSGNYTATFTFFGNAADAYFIMQFLSDTGFCSGTGVLGINFATANLGTPLPIPTPSPGGTPTPTPAPTPSPGPSATALYYNATSAATIEPSPQITANSATKIAYYAAFSHPIASHQEALVTFTGSSPATHSGFAIGPVYYSHSSDPLVTLNCATNPSYGCMTNGAHHSAGTVYPISAIHIPQWGTSEGNTPNCGSNGSSDDCHMGIVDYTFSPPLACDLYSVQPGTPSGGWTNGSTIAFANGECNYINQTGWLYSSSNHSNLSYPGLTVRASEINQGRIPHALFGPVNCANSPNVFPALAGDGTSDYECGPGNANGAYAHAGCGNSNTNVTDCPQYGDHIWLDCTDAEISALPNANGSDTFCSSDWNDTSEGPSPLMKIIWKAFHDYGLIIADTGYGDNALGIQVNIDDDVASVTTGGSPLWKTILLNDAGSYGVTINGKYTTNAFDGTSPTGRFNWPIMYPSSNYIGTGDPGATWFKDHFHVLSPCVAQKTC